MLILLFYSDIVFLNMRVYTLCETHFYDLVLPNKLVNDHMHISSVPSVLVMFLHVL